MDYWIIPLCRGPFFHIPSFTLLLPFLAITLPFRFPSTSTDFKGNIYIIRERRTNHLKTVNATESIYFFDLSGNYDVILNEHWASSVSVLNEDEIIFLYNSMTTPNIVVTADIYSLNNITLIVDFNGFYFSHPPFFPSLFRPPFSSHLLFSLASPPPIPFPLPPSSLSPFFLISFLLSLYIHLIKA